jgi:hypothetical protein
MHDVGFKGEPLGSFDLRRTRVHRDHFAPEVRDLLGKDSISTTEIEDTLARLRGEKVQDRRT